jgi:hypothetical protein
MLRMKWLLPTPAPPRTAITKRCWRGRRLSGLTFGLLVVVIFQSSFAVHQVNQKGGSPVKTKHDSFTIEPGSGVEHARTLENLAHFSAGVKQNFIGETKELQKCQSRPFIN